MKKEGFTLIELMIVVAVIGLLVAVAMPRFTRVADSAKVAQVQGDLTSVRTSIAMFYVKSNSAFPIFQTGSGSEDQNLDTVRSPRATFTDFYSKSILPKSPVFSSDKVSVDATNIVYDLGEEQDGQGEAYRGGWTYDGENGDFFAALEQGVYNDNTDWSKF